MVQVLVNPRIVGSNLGLGGKTPFVEMPVGMNVLVEGLPALVGRVIVSPKGNLSRKTRIGGGGRIPLNVNPVL